MDELWLSSKNMKAIAFILMIAAPLAVGAEVSPIRLRVEQVSKDTHGKFDHKQEKSLKVELSNSSADELGGVKVSYFYFAREVKSGDLAQVGKGEMTAQVKAHGSTMLETPGVWSPVAFSGLCSLSDSLIWLPMRKTGLSDAPGS